MNEQSKPVVRKDVLNAYTKGNLYCLMFEDTVEKYPLVNIFRITEQG